MKEEVTEREARAVLPGLFQQWTGEEPHVEFGEGRADAAIRLGPITLVVEVKASSGVASVEQALNQLRTWVGGSDDIPLLVVPYMTSAGRERCEEAGVSWVDLSGNAHVVARRGGNAFWVHVEGIPNAYATRGRPRNAFAPKASRLARTLLSAQYAPLTQAEIADMTGLDPGHVSRLVSRLMKTDLVAKDVEGRVVVPEPALLLEAWADANAYRHEVVAGHLPGRSGDDRARRLGSALSDANLEHAFTGLAAAWAYTHAAGFRSAACYARELPPPGVLEAVGFRADTEAPNVRLLIPDDVGVFEGERSVNGLRCVAPAQAYVDLRHESERAEELAAELRPLVLSTPNPSS